MKLPRHITASRTNGRLSDGPVTPEGKQASARNSLRHGMLARAVVLDDESTPFFQELLAQFTDEHQPSTPSEFALVQKLVIAYWRQMRGWSIEKSIIDEEMSHHDKSLGPAVRAARSFRTLADSSPALALMHRYETSYDRQFNRSLSQLEKQRQHNTVENAPYEPVTPAAGTWCEDLPNEPDPTTDHSAGDSKPADESTPDSSVKPGTSLTN